ncbi:MAG: YbdK family carboxylate-amine ligase [Thermoleophilia bacterium]|nr:YbdK family carboxylate-amine ligase [Thermoleophilia bacterium]
MLASTPDSTSQLARRIRGYGTSSAYSLGVEEEFQLLDPETFELTPKIDALLAGIDPKHHGQVKHELMQGVVETSTVVCANIGEAYDDLARLRTLVIERAGDVGAVVASAGTTPVSRWEGQQVTNQPRYQDIVARLQYIARRELIFGLHVHVGVDSADKCIYVFNALREELPLLLALSSNSPFWQGMPTGLQSSRIKVFDAFPRSGMPPEMTGGWDEFQALLDRGATTGLVPDHTYLWWDVRPHPDFGTIEVRICDAQTRLVDTTAIAALVQALVAWHGDRFDAGVALTAAAPSTFIEENRWNAARYGIDGEMLDFATDQMVPTRQLLARLLDRLEGVSTRLGSREHFDAVGGMLARTGASRQLAAWAAGGESTRAVGEQLVRDTAAY